jgi:nucleoside-diphosphate-sugar epimerase
MRALVTGSRGLLGRYLVEAIVRSGGHEVFAATRSKPESEFEVHCDLADRASVAALLATVRPDAIFHLAGSFSNNFDDDMRDNVFAARNLFEAMIDNRGGARVVVAGSAAEYGIVEDGSNPVREEHHANPVTTYGLTKLYQTEMTLFYARTKGLDAIVARLFNVWGKGASQKLFIGRVERQIAAYLAGTAKSIAVGSLDAYRDYIPAEETARALITLMKSGTAGEIYNVGSGVPVQMKDVLKRLLDEAGVEWSAVQSERSANTTKYDVPVIYADVSKLRDLGE